MLDQLGLSHVKQPFRDNGVNGRVLAILDETVRRFPLYRSMSGCTQVPRQVAMGMTTWPQ